jgi:hypothetical protein
MFLLGIISVVNHWCYRGISFVSLDKSSIFLTISMNFYSVFSDAGVDGCQILMVRKISSLSDCIFTFVVIIFNTFIITTTTIICSHNILLILIIQMLHVLTKLHGLQVVVVVVVVVVAVIIIYEEME